MKKHVAGRVARNLTGVKPILECRVDADSEDSLMRGVFFKSVTNRSGMSLVELMISLLITSMLLGLLMGLTGQLRQSNQRLIENPPQQHWLRKLKRMLQTDFENCRFVAQDGLGIRLTSYSTPISAQFTREDVDGRVESHIPVLIRYSVSMPENSKKQSGRTVKDKQESISPILTREEILVDRLPPDNRTIDVAARGIASLRILQTIDLDVAPPILKLEIRFSDGREPEYVSLVRFGGTYDDQ